MSFKDERKIWATVSSMIDAAQPRARNRARINAVFNGNPPYTESEADANRIQTNVNFLEGTRIIHHARSSFANAFLKPNNYMTVKVNAGPSWKRDEWSNTITAAMNRRMKRRGGYRASLLSMFGGSVLHGIGPIVWDRDKDWCPKARGVEDILVPTGTETSFDNLSYFAIRSTYTAAQLQKMTGGDPVDPGWNKGLVKQILVHLREIGTKMANGVSEYTNYDFPEKLEEDFKENSGFWGSDTVPRVCCYDFYYLDDRGDHPVYRRKIILDERSENRPKVADKSTVLYDGKNREYGDDVTRIMHVLFADGAVVAPFRWHSVRSLGFLLYSVVHLQNRLRSRFNDAMFEQMNQYFWDVTNGDDDRLQKVDLVNLSVIPAGLKWVPAKDRFTFPYELINGAMAGNRQLMAENSAMFIQDPNAGQSDRMTATETIARVNAANALLGSMLADGWEQMRPQVREVARRFASIDHKDAVAFRRECLENGVDPRLFTKDYFDAWDIEPERVMGNGNKMLEVAEARALFEIRGVLSPKAQQIVTRLYVSSHSEDPTLPETLVPFDEQAPSPSAEKASFAWGTLMHAIPVLVGDAINRVEYVEVLMGNLDTTIQRIDKDGGTPDLETILGLANVISHIEEHVEIVSQDPDQEQRVRLYMDVLKNSMNSLKAYLQRAQEAAQKEAEAGGGDPEALAKIQAIILQAQTKAQIASESALQKRQQKQDAFEADQARRDRTVAGDNARKIRMAEADIAAADLRTSAEIIRENTRPQKQPQPKPKK